MVGFSKRRLPRPKPRRGRVVALFGPQCSGKTTLAQVVVGASNTDAAVVPWCGGGVGELAKLVEAARAGAEVVFVDSVGTPEEVVALYEAGGIDMTGGAVVQVQHDGARCDASAIEQVVRTYSLPYFTVNNVSGDLEAPVAELARRAQLAR